MMRNVFSVDSITYIKKTGKVIYRTGKIKNGKNKKNFSVYEDEEFIAAITQHIPKKSFQTIRYYGWYSNKQRGLRAKAEMLSNTDSAMETIPGKVEVIQVFLICV